jgi:4-hydroxy-tetrahydrodipicolinate synthase
VRLRGTWFVVPTPFDEDGALDLDGQARVVDAAIRWGVDGLTALGVTSEAGELSEEERAGALEVVAEAVGGRVPLVVGCSGPDPATVIRRAAAAAAAGAVAAMVSAPPGHPDPEELPGHFGAVMKDSGLDIVVQDEPVATGVPMPHDVLLACVDAAGSRTVKLEDPPTPPKIARLLEARPDLDVFGGLGGVAALSELRRGACGTMTGFAVPEVLAAVRRHTEAGEHEAAARVFDRALPLVQFEATSGLGVRKELLRRRGAMATNITRRPPAVDPATLVELDDVLRRVGLRPTDDRIELVP